MTSCESALLMRGNSLTADKMQDTEAQTVLDGSVTTDLHITQSAMLPISLGFIFSNYLQCDIIIKK